jgi:hypothetical protein
MSQACAGEKEPSRSAPRLKPRARDLAFRTRGPPRGWNRLDVGPPGGRAFAPRLRVTRMRVLRPPPDPWWSSASRHQEPSLLARRPARDPSHAKVVNHRPARRNGDASHLGQEVAEVVRRRARRAWRAATPRPPRRAPDRCRRGRGQAWRPGQGPRVDARNDAGPQRAELRHADTDRRPHAGEVPAIRGGRGLEAPDGEIGPFGRRRRSARSRSSVFPACSERLPGLASLIAATVPGPTTARRSDVLARLANFTTVQPSPACGQPGGSYLVRPLHGLRAHHRLVLFTTTVWPMSKPARAARDFPAVRQSFDLASRGAAAGHAPWSARLVLQQRGRGQERDALAPSGSSATAR